jgi:hypothetical protein
MRQRILLFLIFLNFWGMNSFAQSYIDGSSLNEDPVWGNSYYQYTDGNDNVVTTEVELLAAINSATTYNANKPYIIPIANDITLTAEISITSSKNIVLRKVVPGDSQPQKWWNFNDPWGTTDADTPDLYDGEPDFFITSKVQSGDAPFHIRITGDNTILTLENITLRGNSTHNGDISNLTEKIYNSGGIIITGNNVVFRGFIDSCAAGTHVGGGICLANSSSKTFSMLGGVISRCISGGNVANSSNGGAIGATDTGGGYGTGKVSCTIQVANSILENCASYIYGGAISFIQGTLTLSGSTIIRDNKARFAGGIFFRNTGTLNVQDNVRIENNTAYAKEDKPAGLWGYPGLGGGIATFSADGKVVINIKGNATFAGNQAYRGGGAICIQAANGGTILDNATAELNLLGGVFTGNEALGIYRNISGSDGSNAKIKYSIGGGGAIYSFDPKVVKIPDNSTVSFENNIASFAAYIDNTALQTQATGNTFFNGDTYISHIKNGNIHTSLVNTHGPAGSDYFNLYNNYDIGVPNNLVNGLYSVVGIKMNPEDGSGGNILSDEGNVTISPDGEQNWLKLGSTLKYTVSPASGYVFEGWVLDSSEKPLQAEIAKLLGLPESTNSATITAKLKETTIMLTAQPFDVTVTAQLKEESRLSLTTPSISSQNIENISEYSPPDWSALTLTASGGYDAEIIKVELIGGDAAYFELQGGTGANHTGTISTGNTDNTTWKVRPVSSLPSLKTYQTQIRVTYKASPGGTNKTEEKEISFSLWFDPFLEVPSGPIDFETGVMGALGSLSRVLKIYNNGIENGKITGLSFTKTDNSVSSEFTASVSVGGGISIDKDAETDVCNISPASGLTAGNYQNTLTISYEGSNLSGTKTVSIPLSITVRTPASVTLTNTLNANNRIKLDDVRENYVLHPSLVVLQLQNSGQTTATITGVTLQSGTSSSFRILTGSLGNNVQGNNGSNSNFSIDIVDGLNAEDASTEKTHTDTIAITYNDGTGIPKTVNVGVEITVKPRQIWEFSLDGTKNYPALCAGATPEAKTITVTQTGNMSLGAMKMSFTATNENFTLNKSALTSSDFTGKTAVFTVTPVSNLSVGTHEVTVKVEYNLDGISDSDCGANADCEYNQKSGSFILFPLSLTVNPIPSLTLTKTSESICSGTSLNLSTLVSSVANGSTHYYIDATCTNVATNPVDNSGTYYLRAENGTTGCKSAAQTITVSSKTPTAIDVQPIGGTTCAGTNITMSVEATGEGTLTYQWKKDGNPISSATNDSYATDIAGSYTVVVDGGCGTLESNSATISRKTPTAIDVQPVGGATCAGTNITMSVEATGEGTLTYQWKKDGNPISSATNDSYATDIADSYTVVVAGGCGTLESNSATISRKTPTAIDVQPIGGATCAGTNITMSVEATGEGTLTYQWKKDGNPISSATNDSYATDIAGSYTVVVAGGCGTLESNSVIVDIYSSDATLNDLQVNGVSIPGFDPQITEYSYIVPCDVYLADITAIKNHANATATSLTNQRLTPGENRYDLTVTAENGFTTRTYSIVIARKCYMPRIVKDLEDAIICVNDSHTFEVGVEGDGLTYEWYYGNSRIPGANTNRYTIAHARPTDYEKYYVIVWSNYNGYHASIYSKQVRLWVTEQLPETLKFEIYPNPAVTGETYHLKLAGYPDVTEYVWRYTNDDVTFSPETGVVGENETWATFGTLSEGTGTVTATLTHPCGTREVSRTIRVTYPTGIEDVTANQVAIYPNPTTGEIRISNTIANQVVRITDVTGSLKGSYRTQEGVTTIDLTGYVKGTYLVHYDGKAFKVIRK